jgi:DNA-binding MarR family transcriptional regulator
MAASVIRKTGGLPAGRRTAKKRAPVGRKFSPERDVYTHPGFLARRFQQIGTSIFMEETAEHDITPLQVGVMAAVRSNPGIDQIGVSERVGLDRTTVLGIVDRLERKAWVQRRAKPNDRRVRLLFLTAKGMVKLDEIQPCVEHFGRRLLNPLNEAERKTLIELIRRVVSFHNEESRVPIFDPALHDGVK